MLKAEFEDPLNVAVVEAKRWLSSVDQRPVSPAAKMSTMLEVFGEQMPIKGEPPEAVVRALAESAEPGLMATGSGRFFAWVVGGALPAAIAADWLVSAWDQNAAMAEPFPAVCAIEQVTARLGIGAAGPSRGLFCRLCNRRSDGQHRVSCRRA